MLRCIAYLFPVLAAAHGAFVITHALQWRDINSAAGNCTRVFRVTGGNTNHYTTADLKNMQAAFANLP